VNDAGRVEAGWEGNERVNAPDASAVAMYLGAASYNTKPKSIINFVRRGGIVLEACESGGDLRVRQVCARERKGRVALDEHGGGYVGGKGDIGVAGAEGRCKHQQQHLRHYWRRTAAHSLYGNAVGTPPTVPCGNAAKTTSETCLLLATKSRNAEQVKSAPFWSWHNWLQRKKSRKFLSSSRVVARLYCDTTRYR
jgi:hypothetical protein